MSRLDLRDPNNKLYVLCTFIGVVIILAATAVSVIYFIVEAPSQFHTLYEGSEPPGAGMPIACGIIYFVCLALLIKDIRKRLNGCPPEEKDARFMRAPLSKAGILFAVTCFTTLTVIAISHVIGEEITQSFLDEYSTYALMAMMICAGPEEEILTRAICIGLPVFIICAIKGRGRFKDILGGFGMSKVAFVFLVISAVIFGLLHLEGWSIMKFPDTFISGMLFGYVYIQYGLHATIVMHSAFDMLASFDTIYEGTGTVPIIILAAAGAILLVRSLLKIREYLPENLLHERFEGSVLEQWERE